MEIPCRYTFHEEKSLITKLEALLSEDKKQLSSELSACTCSPICNDPVEDQNKTEATDNSSQYASLEETQKQLKLDDYESSGKQMWVKFGRIQLSKLDRKEIDCGDWLTDKHINYAQTLIRSVSNSRLAIDTTSKVNT